MKFNSKSVMLNRGVNLQQKIQVPIVLVSYDISEEVWKKSIAEFNKELDERRQVSEIIAGITVDILRINKNVGNLVLWMFAKENDVDTINNIKFSLKGKLVFEDEQSDKIDRVLIEDLIYESAGWPSRSIFKKKS